MTAALRKKKDVEDPNNTWDMQLMAASLKKDLDAIAPLQAKGGNINHYAQDPSRGNIQVTPFIAAALSHGDADTLKHLVQHGADPNLPINPSTQSNSIFHYLVQQELGEVLDKLCSKRTAIAANFSLELVNKTGATALQEAVSRGLPELARILVKHGAQMHTFRELADSDFNQAARACVLGDLQKLEHLLGSGDSALQLDRHGQTLLHLSVGFPGVLDFLLERGLSINSFDAHGDTVLTAHLKSKKPSWDTIELLVGKGADVNLGDETFGMTPLMLGIQGYHADIVRKLLGPDMKAEVNIRDRLGGTALHWAVSARLKGILELLLQTEGVDINAADHCGETALHRAASRGRLEALQLLLQSPLTDVNLQDHEGRNALHLAVDVGGLACAKLLAKRAADDVLAVGAAAAAAKDAKKPPAKRGAGGPGGVAEAAAVVAKLDLETADVNGETPLQMAVRLNNTPMAELLVEAGSRTRRFDKSGRSLLHLAVLNNNDGLVRVLLKQGADAAAHDDNELSPLHLAATNGNVEIARLLLSSGAVVDDQEKSYLRSPLHIACERGDVALAQLLVEAGHASVLLADGGINTPLHVACEMQCLALVKLLLANGASLSVTNARGCTPLHCCCSRPPHCAEGLELLRLPVAAGSCDVAELFLAQPFACTVLYWSNRLSPSRRAS